MCRSASHSLPSSSPARHRSCSRSGIFLPAGSDVARFTRRGARAPQCHIYPCPSRSSSACREKARKRPGSAESGGSGPFSCRFTGRARCGTSRGPSTCARSQEVPNPADSAARLFARMICVPLAPKTRLNMRMADRVSMQSCTSTQASGPATRAKLGQGGHAAAAAERRSWLACDCRASRLARRGYRPLREGWLVGRVPQWWSSPRIRTATTMPDATVSAATTATAVGMPNASATTPERTAPTANPPSRQRR